MHTQDADALRKATEALILVSGGNAFTLKDLVTKIGKAYVFLWHNEVRFTPNLANNRMALETEVFMAMCGQYLRAPTSEDDPDYDWPKAKADR